ncbi:MAG: oligosaccharide flippase family protein [Chloroflexota bacterium]|nr:oligosaccharide flippase family protein [Dehalococcoidia bacterium]MDW8252659.1 oligosaccharide flippase family protein [Chloroflexota bacterium]
MSARLTAWLPARLRRLVVSEGDDAAAWRTRQLSRSLLTSLASKGVSSILQLVAMPVAIRALGAELYGVYAVLAGALSWITMSGVGIGPGLTLRLASGAGGPDAERRLVTTAALLMSAAAGLALAITAALVASIGIPGLFGSQLLAYETELTHGLIAMSILLAIYLVSTVVDAAQAGYQNQYLSNLWTIAGNLLTIALLLLVIPRWSTVVILIVVIYGSMALTRVANGISLVVRRPYLIPRWNAISLKVALSLLSTGGAFFIGQLAAYVFHQYGAFLVGRIVGPQDAARYAVMSQVIVIAIGLVTMITTPLWPAIADARARRDISWILAIYRRTRLTVMGLGTVAGLSIAIAGEPVIARWITPDVAPTLAFQALSGCFLAIDAWDNLHYCVLMGLNRPWLCAGVFALSAVVLIGISAILVPLFGLAGMAASQCLGRLLVMSWLLPFLISRELRLLRT